MVKHASSIQTQVVLNLNLLILGLIIAFKYSNRLQDTFFVLIDAVF